MRVVPFIFLAILLSGCASLVEKAQKFYEAGAYEEAITYYEKALDENPQDEDAIIGLRNSRLKWIDQKLVAVRLLRLGGNTRSSLDTLKKVFSSESEWGLFPTGAVAFTQEEESEYGATSVRVEIEKLLRDKKPLLAAVRFQEYNSFFQAKRATLGLRLVKQTRELGQSGCKLMTGKMNRQDYYFGLFVQKYCAYFGEKSPSLKQQSAIRSGLLYKDLNYQVADTTFDPIYQKIIETALKKGLRNSPWFDAETKNSVVLVGTGNFKSSHDVENVTLKHSYSVQVPYTESRTVPKPKEPMKKSDLENALSLIHSVASIANIIAGGTSGGGTSESDNGDGTMTITETRYVSEPRSVDYEAKIHKQKFEIRLTGNGKLNSQTIDLSLSDKFENETVEHHNNMPNIGLSPESAKLIPEAEWITSKADELSTQFEVRAQKVWRDLYCENGVAGDSKTVTAEQVFRCLRAGTSSLPPSYNNWFKEVFGISYSQAAGLFGTI